MTAFPLTRLFPRELYPPVDRKLIPHFMVALGQPNETILAQIDKRGGPDDPHQIYKLTPFALAVLSQNRKLVEELLEKKANPFPEDRIGWTPLHYAEITEDKEMSKMLLAAAKMRRLFLPSLSELTRVLGNEKWAGKIPGAEVIDPFTQEKSPLTAARFQKLFGGASFCVGTSATRESLIQYWAQRHLACQGAPAPESFDAYLTASLDVQRALPPFPISVIPRQNGRHRIVAGKEIDIETGVIGVWGGRIGDVPEYPSYQIGELNCRTACNLFSLIPDGMPNCVVERVEVGGFPHFVIFPIVPISKGNSFYVDYGACHPSKHRFQPISRQTIEYYKDLSLESEIKFLLAQLSAPFSLKDHLFFRRIYTEVSYLFNTPFLMIRLLFNKTLKAKTIIATVESKILSLTDKREKELFQKIIDSWGRNFSILKAWDSIEKHPLSNLILKKAHRQVKEFHIDAAIYFLMELERRSEEIQIGSDIERLFCDLQKNAQSYRTYIQWFENSDKDQENVLFERALIAISSILPEERIRFFDAAFIPFNSSENKSKFTGFLELVFWFSLKSILENVPKEKLTGYQEYLSYLSRENLIAFRDKYLGRFGHLAREKCPENAPQLFSLVERLLSQKIAST